MSTTFYFRYYDTQPDKQQPEGSRNQTKAAQRADLLHNNRSAANSLAQTIDAASSSTEEAKVESIVSPPPCTSDGADQKAPQASQLRLARRRPEFFGQAHERRDLLQLPCSPRLDLAHAALNSAAAQPLVAHELVKEQACFSQAASDFLLFFLFRSLPLGLTGQRAPLSAPRCLPASPDAAPHRAETQWVRCSTLPHGSRAGFCCVCARTVAPASTSFSPV